MKESITAEVRRNFLCSPHATRKENIAAVQRNVFLARAARCRKTLKQTFAVEVKAFRKLTAEQEDIIEETKKEVIEKIKLSWEYFSRKLNGAVLSFLASDSLPNDFPAPTATPLMFLPYITRAILAAAFQVGDVDETHAATFILRAKVLSEQPPGLKPSARQGQNAKRLGKMPTPLSAVFWRMDLHTTGLQAADTQLLSHLQAGKEKIRRHMEKLPKDSAPAAAKTLAKPAPSAKATSSRAQIASQSQGSAGPSPKTVAEAAQTKAPKLESDVNAVSQWLLSKGLREYAAVWANEAAERAASSSRAGAAASQQKPKQAVKDSAAAAERAPISSRAGAAPSQQKPKQAVKNDLDNVNESKSDQAIDSPNLYAEERRLKILENEREMQRLGLSSKKEPSKIAKKPRAAKPVVQAVRRSTRVLTTTKAVVALPSSAAQSAVEKADAQEDKQGVVNEVNDVVTAR